MNTPPRICRQCGTPLAPNEKFCGNCGAPFIEIDTMNPTERASGSNPNQPPPSSPYPGTPSSPYQNNPYSHTTYGSGGPGEVPPPPPSSGSGYTPPSYPSTSEVYGPGPAPGYLPPTYPPGPQIPQVPQQPQKRKGLGVWGIFGIVATVIVLLVCACGGILYAIGSNQPHPTVVATATPTTASTPTPSPTLVPQALFKEDFSSPQASWETGSGTGFSSSISKLNSSDANTSLVMNEANKKILTVPLPNKPSYDNFSVTVKLTLVQGDRNDSAGLVMRESSDKQKGYYVDIFGDNSYDIVKVTTDADNKNHVHNIIAPTNSSAIRSQGNENTIQVIMKNSTIELIINQITITSVTDSTFSNGPMEIFAENGDTSTGVKAGVSAIRVDPAPEQLPS